jgi:hypothetical protein
MAYPEGPGYGAGFQPQSRVRFETISEAWRLLQQQMGVWVGAMCVYLGVTLGIYAVGWIVLLPIFLLVMPHGDGPGFLGTLGMMGAFFALIIVVVAASSVMLAGLYRLAIKQVRGEPIALGDLFSAVDLAGPALLGTLLVGVATMIGAMFCIIPAYIVQGLLMLTLPIIADRRIGPLDAMKESWNALKSDALMATLYMLVLPFVAGLGSIACGVGVVVTMPLLFLGTALVYRDFFLAPYGASAGYAPAPYSAPPAAPAPDAGTLYQEPPRATPPAAPEPMTPPVDAPDDQPPAGT